MVHPNCNRPNHVLPTLEDQEHIRRWFVMFGARPDGIAEAFGLPSIHCVRSMCGGMDHTCGSPCRRQR